MVTIPPTKGNVNKDFGQIIENQGLRKIPRNLTNDLLTSIAARLSSYSCWWSRAWVQKIKPDRLDVMDFTFSARCFNPGSSTSITISSNLWQTRLQQEWERKSTPQEILFISKLLLVSCSKTEHWPCEYCSSSFDSKSYRIKLLIVKCLAMYRFVLPCCVI